MANLIVRGLDPKLVKLLKERAVRHGRSAEAEHRAILAEVLARAPRPALAAVIAAIPNVGRDEDFARPPSKTR